MNRIEPGDGDGRPGACVICSSDCQILGFPGTSSSCSTVCPNSLREDDVYSAENLSESICHFLHLPSKFKDRFVQNNIFFCKSCACSTQRIHMALTQLKSIQLELNGLKRQFQNFLKKSTSTESQSKVSQRRKKWTTESLTTSLRTDVINEISKSSKSGGKASTNTNRNSFEDILALLLNTPGGFVDDEDEQLEGRVLLCSGEIVGNDFKQEIEECSDGAEQDWEVNHNEIDQASFSESELQPPTTSKKGSRRRTGPNPLQKLPGGSSTDRTLRVKLTRLEDESKSVEIEKGRGRRKRNAKKQLVDTSAASLADCNRDEEKVVPPKKIASKKPKRTWGRKPKETNDREYLMCLKEGCPYKFLVLEDDRAGAEVRRDAHIKRIHEGIKYPFGCSECPKTFGTRQQQVEHVRIHTGETPYICEVCGKGFRSSHLLQFHLKIHNRTGEPSFCCELCPDKFFNAPTLVTHMLTHTKERAFVCGICSSSFLRKHDLQNHQRYAHAEVLGLEQYKCRFCDKVLTKKLSLVDHEKTHTKDGKFKCSICDYRSNVRSRIRFHENSHALERTHKCDVCDKAYKHEFLLEIHKRSHTGERPFKCKVCQAEFKARSHLYIHEQTHGDLKHKCSFCGQGFTLKKYLLRHEDRHRSGKLQKRWKRPEGQSNDGPEEGELPQTNVQEPTNSKKPDATATDQPEVIDPATNDEPILTTINTAQLFQLNIPGV